MIIIDDIDQGSKEWVKLRLGVVTASGSSKLFSFGKKTGWIHARCFTLHSTHDIAIKCKKGDGKPEKVEELTATLSSQRTSYRNKLLAEWATGEPQEDWMGSEWTERGLELEGEATSFFEFETGLHTRPCAFIFRDETRQCGASPDALVIDSDGSILGGLELKCPKLATHFGYLLDGRDKYEEQVQMSLWASQLPRWWFLSYYPGQPPYLEVIEPQAEYQAAFNEHLPVFLEELAECKNRLQSAGVVPA